MYIIYIYHISYIYIYIIYVYTVLNDHSDFGLSAVDYDDDQDMNKSFRRARKLYGPLVLCHFGAATNSYYAAAQLLVSAGALQVGTAGCCPVRPQHREP